MKIIIVGAGGFVGKNLIRVMHEEGIKGKDLIAIDKNIKGLEYARKFGCEARYADVSMKGEWMDLFKGADVCINLSAQISSKEFTPFKKNNVDTTKFIVEACKNNKVKKVIQYSSAAVLSVRKDHYAETKLQSENIVKKSKLRYVVLQPSLMYGPLDDKNIGYLINFAKKSPFFPIPGSGKYPRQPIYIDDICKLTVRLAKKFPAKNKVYSINGKETIEFGTMIKTVLRNMKGTNIPIHIPIPIFKFMMVTYQLLFGEKFTTDQVDSLTSGDVFPEYPWWAEYKIPMTPYEEGVRNMLLQMGLLKRRFSKKAKEITVHAQ